MSEDGDDKLLAMARHLVKTMGRTDTMTDDLLQIFSSFDDRFSREKLSGMLEDDGSTGSGSGSGSNPSSSFAKLDRTLRYLDRQISRSLSSTRPIWSDSAESAAFLDAVDTLLGTIRDLDPMVPGDKRILDHADDILHKSMLRLEYEFKALIDQGNGGGSPLDPFSASFPQYESDEDGLDDSDDRIPVAQPVTDYNIVIDALPWGTISDLHEIAKRMVAARFAKECANVYSVARQDFLDESISRLGLRPWSTAEVHAAPWEELEEEIKRWVQGVKVAFRILIPSERRLCDRVFADLGPVADLSFSEVCRGPAYQLLGFADAIATGTKSPERLFPIVDLYEALRDLIPEVELMFCDQYCSFVREEAWNVSTRLGAAIRGIFTELENLIRRDPANLPLPGGGLHPITRYVMNYLRAASASWRTLEEVMEEEPTGAPTARDSLRPSSSFSVQIAWIMKLLLSNLDAKAAVYRDVSLSSVFRMNNGRYIIQKVRDSELAQLLGEEWIRGQVARVRQWQSNYMKNSWGKVVELLRADGGGSSDGGAAAIAALKERIQKFNVYLDDIYRVQTGWTVAEEELKMELKNAISESIIPGYRSLLARVRSSGGREAARQMDRSVKYNIDDVEARISGLFQGTRRTSS